MTDTIRSKVPDKSSDSFNNHFHCVAVQMVRLSLSPIIELLLSAVPPLQRDKEMKFIGVGVEGCFFQAVQTQDITLLQQ